MVVVAKVEVALTVKPLPAEKVNNEDVAKGLVPLPNNISPAVTAELPVPPLVTGRTPATSEVREACPL